MLRVSSWDSQFEARQNTRRSAIHRNDDKTPGVHRLPDNPLQLLNFSNSFRIYGQNFLTSDAEVQKDGNLLKSEDSSVKIFRQNCLPADDSKMAIERRFFDRRFFGGRFMVNDHKWACHCTLNSLMCSVGVYRIDTKQFIQNYKPIDAKQLIRTS